MSETQRIAEVRLGQTTLTQEGLAQYAHYISWHMILNHTM